MINRSSSTTTLIECVCGDTASPLAKALGRWCELRPRFADFVAQYQGKIQRKVRQATTPEDALDLQFELELPYLLLGNERFCVEYEVMGRRVRAPDFKVLVGDRVSFYLEVARIREGDAQKTLRAWERDLKTGIRAIPSNLVVSVNILSFHGSPDTVRRLQTNANDILSATIEVIQKADASLPIDATAKYPLPGFENQISLCITKSSKNTTHQTVYGGGTFPVPYTQKEYRKFGDILCEKLAQMHPSSANILAISSGSDTHDDGDCEEAISNLYRKAFAHDDAFFIGKGFRGAVGFLSLASRVSGVLFKTKWIGANGNCMRLWCNKEASMPIPADIAADLLAAGEVL